MRLTGDWLIRPPTRAVCAAVQAAGHRVFFVGGCVRDAALGRPVGDIDMATDAAPDAVIAAGTAAGLKALPTGIAHGTVTLVADGLAHEITTFRRDVETFGRHARVAFDAGLTEDAARRDFTINALYATPEGEVLDPLGTGLSDLAARRVRFVGDATLRIAEDGLRILRFFRFHAHFADPEGGIDPDGLAACAAGIDALALVSAERRGAEMRKLLSAPDPAPAVAAMAQAGVLAQVLPGADPATLTRLIATQTDHAPDWALRLAALDSTGGAAQALRLSRHDAGRIGRLRKAALSGAGAAELGWRLGAEDGAAALCLHAALAGLPLAPGWQTGVAHGANATFPIAASDLMPAFSGPALGATLRRLEAAWIASGMTMGHAPLLAMAQHGAPDPAHPTDRAPTADTPIATPKDD